VFRHKARFQGKIQAERSEVWRFSPEPRSGPTLTGREHESTFADREMDRPYNEKPHPNLTISQGCDAKQPKPFHSIK
jgi:hypothetical protein